MSGKPYPEGVNQVRRAATQMAYAQRRIAELDASIADQQLEKALQEDAYRESRNTMIRLMREMDVESAGNAGWEGRFSWFITELVSPFTPPAK